MTDTQIKALCEMALTKLKTEEDINNFMDSMFTLSMIDLSMPEVGRLKARRYDLKLESELQASSLHD